MPTIPTLRPPHHDHHHGHGHVHHCHPDMMVGDYVMKKGETFNVSLNIHFENGEYSADDFSAELIKPDGSREDIELTLEGDELCKTFEGTDTENMDEGSYGFVIWYHKGIENQKPVVLHNAFTLTDMMAKRESMRRERFCTPLGEVMIRTLYFHCQKEVTEGKPGKTLTYDDLTEEQIKALQRPATEAAENCKTTIVHAQETMNGFNTQFQADQEARWNAFQQAERLREEEFAELVQGGGGGGLDAETASKINALVSHVVINEPNVEIVTDGALKITEGGTTTDFSVVRGQVESIYEEIQDMNEEMASRVKGASIQNGRLVLSMPDGGAVSFGLEDMDGATWTIEKHNDTEADYDENEFRSKAKTFEGRVLEETGRRNKGVGVFSTDYYLLDRNTQKVFLYQSLRKSGLSPWGPGNWEPEEEEEGTQRSSRTINEGFWYRGESAFSELGPEIIEQFGLGSDLSNISENGAKAIRKIVSLGELEDLNEDVKSETVVGTINNVVDNTSNQVEAIDGQLSELSQKVEDIESQLDGVEQLLASI